MSPRGCCRVVSMRSRAVAITWCVGRGAAAVAGGLALGTGERGSELAAVLQQLEGPHHQPVTAPIWRVPAGLWPPERCEIGSGGALLDDGHVPRTAAGWHRCVPVRRDLHLEC